MNILIHRTKNQNIHVQGKIGVETPGYSVKENRIFLKTILIHDVKFCQHLF